MKKLARLLSWFSLFSGLSTLFPMPRRFIYQKGKGSIESHGYLMPLLLVDSIKSVATLFGPVVAANGLIGFALGLLKRDRISAIAGLLGWMLQVRNLGKIIMPHVGFEHAFGPDWEERIPPEVRPRLSDRRWQWRAPKPPSVPWKREVVFGHHEETGDPLECDLWLAPESVRPTGLGIIYLHGSGWHLLDKDFGTRYFLARLAAQGHVIMDTAYTMAPKADMQGMLNDVRRAICWMKTQGTAYGANPERVVLMGGSAGAHLALLAAYASRHPRLVTADIDVDTSVRAVVSFYGIADLASLHYQLQHVFGPARQRRSAFDIKVEAWLKRTRAMPDYGKLIPFQHMVSGAMGGTPEELPEEYALYSPLTHVGPHCPPTLILQGAADLGVVPELQSQPLCRALSKTGVPVVHVEYPDVEHGFDLILPRWSPAAQAAFHDVERFLALMV